MLEPHAIQYYTLYYIRVHIPTTHILQLGLQLILAVQIYFKLHGSYRNRSFLSLLEMNYILRLGTYASQCRSLFQLTLKMILLLSKSE